MRTTGKIINNNSLYYLTRNLNQFMKVDEQISMQQQVINLEDDPLSANIGLRLNNTISRSQQYMRNISVSLNSMRLVDGYLGEAKTVMDKISDLIEAGATDSTTHEMRKASAIELNEIFKSLVTAANAFDSGRYVFGGQNTTTPPFSIVNSRYVNYTGNDKYVQSLIDNMTSIATNVTGQDAFGSMTTKVTGSDMNPDVSLATDSATRLSDLNGGNGIPKGRITVYYSSYPNGLDIDLSGCDTLEDVKDRIEEETLKASQALDPNVHGWIDAQSLDWHDMQDRYVKVTVNPEHNGISLQEIDMGEPLPEPTAYETKKGLTYSGNLDYNVGGYGIADGTGPTAVHDKLDYIYGNGTSYYSPLRVDDFSNNKVAEGLGIKGSAPRYDPARPDKALDGFIHGRDLNPVLSDRTLLADLEGYNDSVYTITNGDKPGFISIRETSQDPNNNFNNWNLTGLSKGQNTGPNGELYIKATNRGTTANPEIFVEVFTVPLDRAKASDRVATGTYTQSANGGTVILQEDNASGLGGSVGIILPSSQKEASVSLGIDFIDSLQASVHVPAFVEEQNPDGTPKDTFNIASGWSIRGLDKPPANGYDQNHPASTDLDGDVSVNYRYDAANNKLIVELCRPSYADQPATVIATGELALGSSYAPPGPSTNIASGRVELSGVEGFEGVKGSVYLEIPSGTAFSPATAETGSGPNDATSITFQLAADAPAGSIHFGGATKLVADQDVDSTPFQLAGDTLFKKGQVFEEDVMLPGSIFIPKGVPLGQDTIVPKGATVSVASMKEGTVLAAGQEVTFTQPLAQGTVIPRDSYYTDGNAFPAAGMGMSVTTTDAATGAVTTRQVGIAGYDVRATFATVEDFNRAVEQTGIYVTSRVSGDGKSLEFISTLAGAYLTVSEDTDCYEQMGDKYQQLSGLDLSGLTANVNADKNGNVYTEVIYYAPDPLRPDAKVSLTSANGEVIEIDPGYYVRVYSDPDELKKPYEDRDNTKMVAEGFLKAPKWDDPTDPNYDENNPFIVDDPADPLGKPPYTIGVMQNMVLEERNDSGVSGTVNLDYYSDRDQAERRTVVAPDGTTREELVTNPWGNSAITVFPGGLRPEGSRHATIQEWDMYDVTPGVSCDYAGTFHGVITGSLNTNGVDMDATVYLYKDNSHSVMTAKSDPTELASTDGKVTLYEVDRYGNFVRDANNERIVAGTMTVSRNDLNDGQSDNFVLTTGAARNTGQERADNIFATINDAIDALNDNDAELLHDLLGNITGDISRVLEARGDMAARTKRVETLYERHADDIVKMTASLTARVGMDSTALSMAVLNWQAASNAYQAAMQVSSQIMQMSLLQYI